ncbi:MAG: hypothetical protein EB120_05465 [Proteobacteria bacterium]|nr:hypothetical protein [Pseudomonadota bacterium]
MTKHIKFEIKHFIGADQASLYEELRDCDKEKATDFFEALSHFIGIDEPDLEICREVAQEADESIETVKEWWKQGQFNAVNFFGSEGSLELQKKIFQDEDEVEAK